MADVFVSYVREDRDIAEKLASGLIAAGFSVWWDRHIRGGVEFAKEIERELDAARVVIVLWSDDSLGSRWVRDEAEQAREGEKLIPVRLDGVQPPLGFRQTQALDFTGWKGDPDAATFTGLVDSVRHFVGGGVSSSPGVAAPSTKSRRGRFGWSRQRWVVASIAGAAVVAAAAALLFVGPKYGVRTSTTATDGRIEINAFEPLTKSDELERFAKGIGATLVRVLATSGIRTVAADQTESRGGGTLAGGAEFALRGRVDREGDDVVASANLVNRRDGLVLWSITQKHSAEQTPILEEQFSVNVAGTLRCALRLRDLANGDRSTDLFAQILQFCDALANDIEQTPELARRLVETAPQYASSYDIQATANAFVTVIRTPGYRPPAEIARLRKIVYDSAKIAAEMDPRFDALLARAVVVDPAVGLAQREHYLQQSMAMGSDDKAAVLWAYGSLLVSVGRMREARTALERAVKENPLNQMPRLESARLAAVLGNAGTNGLGIEAARHEFDELRGKVPGFGLDSYRLWTELWLGDGVTAKAIHDRIKVEGARQWNRPECMALLAYARSANVRLSEEDIRRECGIARAVGAMYTYIAQSTALVYAYFGYVDAAFRGLNETQPVDSIQYGLGAYGDLFLPHMRIVRADPRFMPLAVRLGLADYWLDTDQWPDFCTTDKLPYDCKTAALAARAERHDAAPANPG